MKATPLIGAAVVAASNLLCSVADAQAPTSIAGDGLLIGITYGTYPLASYGYSLLIPANSGNTYQMIGIYGVADTTGTYSYTRTSATSAQMDIYDAVTGNGVATVAFNTPTTGSFDFVSSTYPGLSQGGNFVGGLGAAPTSFTGKRISCTVNDGRSPYASKGGFTLTTSAAGNTYAIAGYGGVGNSSGTYTYSLANRSTAAIQLNDTVAGASTLYVVFSDSSTGVYAVKSSSGGFQTGNFSVLDSTRPTVSISSPASGQTYTNAQTVTITATASDNVGVTNVEFYDNSSFKAAVATVPYTHDWSFDVPDNGAHVWTARAYDAAGNVSTSAPVTLTVSIDITPPTVAILSPTNGATVSASPLNASGTARDSGLGASGLALVQVRLNSGDWLSAVGTTNWNCAVSPLLCGNTLEARSLDKAGNYSVIVSNFFSYIPPNTAPNTPTNISPANGAAGLSLIPLLQASAFSDPDPPCIGDTHTASHWQVYDSSGLLGVWGSGTTTVYLTSWQVPEGKLAYGSNYQWHVRYRDSRNGWSSFSPWTRFAVGGPPLTATKQGTNMIYTWPTNASGFTLQWSTNPAATTWSNATPAPRVVNGKYTVTNNMADWSRFYRLKR